MRKGFRIAVVLMILFLISGISEAVIREGGIKRQPGISFSGLQYSFRSLNVTLRNNTKSNVNFGGSMIFLDRNHKVIAHAELLSVKLKRYSSRRCRASFTYGSGDEARKAKYLEWEF